jgi:hypothetical protein
MRTTSRLAMALVGLALLACDDNSPGTPLFGTWNVTKSEYVGVGDPPASIDVIAAGGSGTIAPNADASYDATIVPPGGERTKQRYLVVHRSSLTMRESGSRLTWVFDRRQRVTPWCSGADAEFDFAATRRRSPPPGT